MVNCLNPGKVVVILAGKHAGQKAVIVYVNDTPTKKYKFPHAMVVGIERGPRRVSPDMDEKTINKRTSMKVFYQIINLQHFMPTRFVLGCFDHS